MEKAINDFGAESPHDKDCSQWCGGMSLRDWFAGQALPAAIENQTLRCRSGVAYGKATMPMFGDKTQADAMMVAATAYALADAMIAQRDAPNEADARNDTPSRQAELEALALGEVRAAGEARP